MGEVDQGNAANKCERLRDGLMYLRDMTPAGWQADGTAFHNADWVSAVAANILAGREPIGSAADPHGFDLCCLAERNVSAASRRLFDSI